MNKPQRRLTDQIKRFATVIGADSLIRGNLGGNDDYVILGRVEGDADIGGTLVIQEGGHWQGNILADNVIVCGEVEGDITARNKLEITSTARIRGNLSGQSIAIAEGAVFEGEIRMQMQQDVTYFDDRRAPRVPERS